MSGLKKMHELNFREKGNVLLLSDFNAGDGRSV